MLRCAVITALALLPWAVQSPASTAARHEFRRGVMGTEARIVLFAPSEVAARAAAGEAFARMLEVEAVASDWISSSELSQLGVHSGGAPQPISALLFEVLAQAREVAELTDGHFDPTLGPLTLLWRTHREAGTLPAPAEIEAARALVGWRDLELDPQLRTARLARAGMRLDLGGIAKGFACDEALASLQRSGFAAALVELGGDLVVGAAPPDRPGWRIALDCADAGAPREELLVDQAAATSGDAYQHLDHGGERYSHVLDPRTGLGLQTRLCTSVIAPTGALADALASALNVAGPSAGEALVARFPGVRVLHSDARRRALFDGQSLAGWTTVGGRYDGDALWSVEDGVLVGRTGPEGAGGLLYTHGEYRRFELELETRIEYPFDSGIFLHMVPREQGGRGLQITLDDRPDGELAGVYSDGWLQHNPSGDRHWKRDEWNHVRVRCTGADLRLEVWINGEPALDYTLPADSEGFAATGKIGLQVHPAEVGSPNAVRFRKILILALD